MVLGATTDIGYTLIALWAPERLQPVLRRWAQRRYEALAPRYDSYIANQTGYGSALHAALTRIPSTPRRVLDVSTGTGYAAQLAARRYPAATVLACDLSDLMVQQAQQRLRAGTVVRADSACLPFADEAFDLVILHNAPPSLRELARTVAPGGWLVLAFSAGASVPGWLRSRLVRRLTALGFADVAWDQAGAGLCIVAGRNRPEGSR